MEKTKIFCPTCEGKKTISEKKYPTGEEIQVTCPACNGKGWVPVLQETK